MRSVTGTVSSTVVTLSRNAENTAVTIDIISRMPQGRASTFFADQIATYWNSPERRVMLTISIMPSRRPSVFQSTAAHRLLLVQHADEDQRAPHPAARRSRG